MSLTNQKIVKAVDKHYTTVLEMCYVTDKSQNRQNGRHILYYWGCVMSLTNQKIVCTGDVLCH
jgi:hypothetical protein